MAEIKISKRFRMRGRYYIRVSIDRRRYNIRWSSKPLRTRETIEKRIPPKYYKYVIHFKLVYPSNIRARRGGVHPLSVDVIYTIITDKVLSDEELHDKALNALLEDDGLRETFMGRATWLVGSSDTIWEWGVKRVEKTDERPSEDIRYPTGFKHR